MKRLTIAMDDTVHKQMKILCVKLEKSLNDFIVNAAVREMVEVKKKEDEEKV